MKRIYTIRLLIFSLTLFSLFFCGLSNHDLWTPDEPRVAEIGREMAESGNFFIPQLNKRAFLEHPPLYYASMAIVFKLIGRATEGLARIPSAIYGLAGALATFLIAYTLFGFESALLSAFILATAFEYFRISHWVVVDSALSCFVFFSMLFFIKGYFAQRERKSRYYLLFYLFLICAFFVKGFIGVIVIVLTVITFLIFDSNIKEIKQMHIWWGFSLFFLSLLLWALSLYTYGGIDYLKIFFIDNNLLRFLPGGKSGHKQPFYYYLTEFPSGFMPWSVFVIPAFFYVFSKDTYHDKKALLFLKCWFISGFILLSLASTKRILYLLPIFAPVSIMISLFIEYAILSTGLKRFYRFFIWLYGCMFLFIGLSFVPAVFYILKKYELTFDSTKILHSASISIVTVFITSIAMFMLKRGRIREFFQLMNLNLFIFLLFVLIVITPQVDRYKSLKPFAEKVKEYVSDSTYLYGYKPDETLRAIIPFYTGMYFKEIHEKDKLLSLNGKDRTIYMVIRDKNNELKKELMEEGFKDVFEYPMGLERSLNLMKR